MQGARGGRGILVLPLSVNVILASAWLIVKRIESEGVETMHHDSNRNWIPHFARQIEVEPQEFETWELVLM
jgi:hypothetical protein